MTRQSRGSESQAAERPVQLSLIDPYHRNRGLFSNHYLDERVSEDPFWQSLLSQAAALREAIVAVWHETSLAQKENASEGGLEDALVRPVLKALGHAYSPQHTLEEESRIPDYIFFPTEAAKAKAESGSKSTFLHDAIAVGDAKAWHVSLDKKVGDGFSMQSPSYQIDYYIRTAGVSWGILTNGRFWRLYHRDTSYRLDTYYEVDLEQLIAQTGEPDTAEKFLYFAAFFCKDAFLPDPNTGESFLARALKGSAQYAKGIGDKLKGNVYEVLRLLCEGFLSLPSNRLTPADMAAIRENAFVVIYRLLFILYAEARGFLPLRNPGYATASLGVLAREIAEKAPDHLSTQQTNYWDRLQNLFGVIDRGDESVDVQPYNGGLFSNEGAHSALTRWKVSDRYVAQAIDLLARVQEDPGRSVFVDYRDLSVRELGTIYEGLLEQQPRYAEVDTAIVKQDKREIYVPADKLKDSSNLPIVHQGSVYLATDKGERKTTGSYYTPDYIVKYIVSHALGPLVEEAKQAHPNTGQELADAILSIKVLDPAMGSGHFLVEAADYLARAYAEAMAPSDHGAGEEDIRLARRKVVERCIYGVDLNPLAVELAKLSLWLYTVSENKPLNFLDHHLRCGNSLIGTEIESLGVTKQPSKRSVHEAPRRDTALFTSVMQQSLASAVSSYVQIEAMPSDRLDQVKQKEQLFAAAHDAIKRYRQVFDIWTSIPFGNAVPADEYANVQMGTNLPGTAWSEFEAQPWFAQAMHIAQQHRFFHWELAFPEVFYDEQGQRKENPGFDAVVGNPPYGSKKILDESEKAFLRDSLSCTGSGDTAEMFIDRGCQLLREGGIISYIVPKPLTYISSWHQIRAKLSSLDLMYLADVSKAFKEVLLEQIVFMAVNRADSGGATINGQLVGDEIIDTDSIAKDRLSEQRFQMYATDSAEPLLMKIEQQSQDLKSLVCIWSGIGGVTSMLSPQPLGPKCYRGDDIARYELLEEQALYLPVGAFTEDDLEDHMARRIVGQDIVAHVTTPRPHIQLAFCIANGGPLTHETVINFTPFASTDIDIHFLLAVLNSTFISWHAYNFIFNRAIRTMHFRPGYGDFSPIRRIAFTTPEQQREGLVEQGKRLYEEYLASGDSKDFLAFIDQCLPQKPDGTPDMQNEQSDVVHDLLAFFAGEMTRLHEEKQGEAHVFLEWLQRYVRLPIDQLAGKTTVKNYWGPQAGRDALITVLVKNRKAIQNAKGPDVTSAAVQAKITQECDPSIQKLRGLERQIALTDRLIDQTVYRLYGLTPEEIDAVEA